MRSSHLWQAVLIAVVVFTALALIGIYLYQVVNSPIEVPPQNALATTTNVASSVETPTAILDATLEASEAVPQSGGTFVQAVEKGATQFNPVLTTNETALAVAHKISPRLLGFDPDEGHIVPTELAASWQISAAGLVYTFTLRPDIFWQDGVPVTSFDFKFTYDAMRNPALQSPFRAMVAPIATIEAPDPHQLIVTLTTPDCAAFQRLRHPLLPSHRYAADFSDFQTNPLNTAPVVGAGPFLFKAHIPNERTVLARNPAYWKGAPYIEQWVYHVIPDPEERRQRLIVGDIDLAKLLPEQVADAGTVPDLRLHQLLDDGFTFISLNAAAVDRPRPGQDENGQLLEQGVHPILGDVAVRRAMAHGLDYDAIIEAVYSGQGIRLSSYVLPTTPWAYADDVAAYRFDRARAITLLANSGWIDEDGDGLRERNGQPLQLTLLTNRDNRQRLQIGQMVGEMLAEIGIGIVLDAVDFEAMSERLLSQQYDMALLGWDNLGMDPGHSEFWHSRADIPGGGYNFGSFQDMQVDQWLDAAQQVPNCDIAARAQYYREVQHRIHQEAPYLLIGGRLSTWGISSQWQGLNPKSWQFDHDDHLWWESN